MKLRHAATLALVAFSLVGCKKKEAPAAGPGPVAVDTAGAGARAADSLRIVEEQRLARLRADSIAREEARVREALSEIVFFEYDSYALLPESEDRLRAKAELLRSYPALRLRIEGHADERGSTEYNLVLGQKRAEVVRDFLSAYGISGERMGTLSYGKERPRVEGNTEAAWAQNRRAEFVVLGGSR